MNEGKIFKDDICTQIRLFLSANDDSKIRNNSEEQFVNSIHNHAILCDNVKPREKRELCAFNENNAARSIRI